MDQVAHKQLIHPATGLREQMILDNVVADNVPNPFKDLPNVKSSWIMPNVLDPLLSAYGFAKKFSPEMEFTRLSSRTRACNRYLRIMHYRLVKLLSKRDTFGFWILAALLMEKSKVLRIVALRKLEPNWHLVFKFGHAKLMLQQLDNTLCDMPLSLEITRQYESKIKSDGTKTFRPIGNPHKVHRMYLYIWQSFFVIFLYSFIGSYQHGFLPGRGTTTAWQRLQRMIKLPYLWEFDLKGAFPSLNVTHTCKRLERLGLPGPIADFVKRMSLETIERIPRAKQELPEIKTDLQEIAAAGSDTHPERYAGGAGMFMNFFGMHAMQAQETRKAKNLPTPTFDASSPLYEQVENFFGTVNYKVSKVLEVLESDKTNPMLLGFPQGSGLSPILFDFAFQDGVINHFNRKFKDTYLITAYADDFLISSRKALEDIFASSDILSAYGFEISLEKSRQLKASGLWLHDSFKFLGTTYDAIRDKVIGTPRSGKRLELDNSKLKGIRFFIRRDEQLSKFVEQFPDYAKSTQAVLDGYGRSEFPFNLIPTDVIERGVHLSSKVLSSIADEISRVSFTPRDARPADAGGAWYKGRRSRAKARGA
jgi:hypothetical protein